MRRLKRNQRDFTYETIKDSSMEVDSQGYKTGRNVVSYNDPVSAKGCIVYKGTSSYKAYGIDEEWTVQIIPDSKLAVTVGTRITIDGKQYYVLSHPVTMNEQRLFCK